MKQIKKTILRGKVVLAISALALLIAMGIIYVKYQHKTTPGNPVTIHEATPPKSTNTESSNRPPTVTSGSSSPGKTPTSGETISIGSPPLAPSGTFVSNHTPNLSGTPAPSSEESVCNGTPGANCYIQFTNSSDGSIFKLLSKVIDDSGSAYWQWDVNTNGLRPGTWQITAVSILGSQSATAKDSRDLTVNK